MAVINKHKLHNVANGSPEDRYAYFIRKITDFEVVWSLYKDGWALVVNDEQKQAIPFWPEEAFAEVCATGTWADYIPRSITLKEFIDRWLPGMSKDMVLAAVFLNNYGKGLYISPEKLVDNINTELSRYY